MVKNDNADLPGFAIACGSDSIVVLWSLTCGTQQHVQTPQRKQSQRERERNDSSLQATKPTPGSVQTAPGGGGDSPTRYSVQPSYGATSCTSHHPSAWCTKVPAKHTMT